MLGGKLNIIGRGMVRKFVVWIVVIIMLLGAITTVFVQISMRKTLSEEFMERGITISKNLATSSVEPLLVEDKITLQRLIESVKKNQNNIVYVFITNARGKVVVHTFEEGFPADFLNTGNDEMKLLSTGDRYIMDFTASIRKGRVCAYRYG